MFDKKKQMSNNEIILYGGDLQSPPCEKNIGQYLLDRMKENADRIAQIDPVMNIIFTHGDIRKYTIRCALEMRTCGVQKADVIVVCGKNHSKVIIPFFAATYLGAISNAIHPFFSDNEMRRMISITEPRIIFCDPDCKNRLTGIRNELGLSSRIVAFNEEFDPYMALHDCYTEEYFVTEKVNPENDNCFIVCTSGTTGLIKGVTLRHSAVYTSIVEFCNIVDPDDKLLIYSPLSWITAIWATTITLYMGSAKFICEYEQTKNLEILSEYKISWALLTPLKIIEMIRHPLFNNYPTIVENLKCLVYGGSRATDEQVMEFRKIFPNTYLWNGYGSSEVNVCHAFFHRVNDYDLNLRKMNSNGKPCPGSYVKVIDPETGKSLGPNENGEMLIKSPTLTKGYYRDPKATAEAIDEEGWYHTGDMVYYDEDQCFYCIGRYKEVLKYKGWQVTPAELEETILSHPAVAMACVMGRSHPTDGDLPMAFIVKKPTMEQVTEEDILNFVNDLVPDIQRLRGGIIFLEKLPLTSTGKVRRIELKKLLE